MLNYKWVHKLKKENPHLTIIVNGGIQSNEDVEQHLHETDGVMIGRQLYSSPESILEFEHTVFGSTKDKFDFNQLLEDFSSYAEEQVANGVYVKHLTKHLANLFRGSHGARKWRRDLTEGASQINTGTEIIWEAFKNLSTFEK